MGCTNIAFGYNMQIQGKQILAIIRSSAITIYPDNKRPQNKLPSAPTKQLARPYRIQHKTSLSSFLLNRVSLCHDGNTTGFPRGIYIDIYV